MSAAPAVSEPGAAAPQPLPPDRPLLRTQDVQVHFPITEGLIVERRVGEVRAVDGVSLEVRRGETVGLVGESGCGKSTFARAVLRLVDTTSGTIEFDGADVTQLQGSRLRRLRSRMQMIFQDPYASLNPRMTIGSMLAEPLRVHGIARGKEAQKRVRELIEIVGLPRNAASRYPHEFSGGQRQRAGIARALAVRPEFIAADEAVSALDVSIQAQIINLLAELQREFGLTYLFIAHDLSVVRHISDRIAVMYLGEVVEQSPSRELYDRPLHPYTAALISAVPIPDPAVETKRRRLILVGDVPSPANPPSGCRFHTRCWLRRELGNPERCVTERPQLREMLPMHSTACHFAEELVQPTRRRDLVASAAEATTGRTVADEEAITPPAGEVPTDSGSLFDPEL
ncbi:MAG TPA: ABC transporter ATP-binding protein [Candidatus Limnocylindria bacterium]|jgi:oligopeptide/dipeptide ABC transporter ATP-binding protein|nr:ABC transporter ATP-binding protein [Candidatus Limnocylindria bacterium]